jgi:branched-chain amino acid transport system permease protein
MAAALAGLAIGLPCLRLRGDYLAIATLGFSLIIVNVLDNLNVVGGARGLPFETFDWPMHFIYQLKLSRVNHYLVHMALAAVAVIVCTIVIRNVIHSRHGRALLSIREDELAGEMCGINIVKYKLFVFVLGAAFAGLAGILYATFIYRIEPRAFDFMEGVRILLMVVLGGMGSLSGTFIAVVLLYEVPVILRLSPWTLFGYPVADYWAIIYALLLIVLMILRPQGLLGSREISQLTPIARLIARFRGEVGGKGEEPR